MGVSGKGNKKDLVSALMDSLGQEVTGMAYMQIFLVVPLA
jgi:hypothetical protein